MAGSIGKEQGEKRHVAEREAIPRTLSRFHGLTLARESLDIPQNEDHRRARERLVDRECAEATFRLGVRVTDQVVAIQLEDRDAGLAGDRSHE